MNNNVKKWIAALRSGKYKQGLQCLCAGDEFCCLGVACDLYAQEHDLKWSPASNVAPVVGSLSLLGQASHLPIEVILWLGMQNAFGRHWPQKMHGEEEEEGEEEETTSLSILNDLGKTFEEIADIIESEPDGLFAKS
jgi:hypothetical protein